MIWASSAPCGNASNSTAGRWRRSRPSASFMAIRDSQVDEAGIAAKTFQMREGADVGLLHDVLGLAVVAQDAAGEPVEPAVVRLHDGADRRLVARQRPPHQFGVAGVEGRALRYVCLAHDGSTNNRVLGLDAAKAKRFPKICRVGSASVTHHFRLGGGRLG